ncbi:MAG: hypothetical protein JKX76_04250 [Colwellia sp.]|nr:hypothetical protein [Colwellia sp.]
MIDYSSWPLKRLSVLNLQLDIENPRLPAQNKHPVQRDIIRYMITEEKVIELAKEIVNKGYFRNEQPIVCKIGSKYSVLEGNRRVTALKLIQAPELISSTGKRRALTNLIHQNGFDPEKHVKINCIVAPTRDAADIMIENRHTGNQIEKWDKIKQDRFYYFKFIKGESIKELATKFDKTQGDIKTAFKRYNLYIQACNLELDSPLQNSLNDEKKFAITNLERFATSALGQDFLGLEFNSKGEVARKLPREEFDKRFKRIVVDILTKDLDSRIYNKDEDQAKYVKSLINSGEFDLNIVHSKEGESENVGMEITENSKDQTGQASVSSSKSAVLAKNKLFPTSLRCETGIVRIDKICVELKGLNLNTHANSAAILFRSFLDMLFYQYLLVNKEIVELKKEEHIKRKDENAKKLDRLKAYLAEVKMDIEVLDDKKLNKALRSKNSIDSNWSPSLMHMLGYVANHEAILDDAKLKSALQRYVKKDSSMLTHSDFNQFVHNEYVLPNQLELKEVYHHLQPLLLHILETINMKEEK